MIGAKSFKIYDFLEHRDGGDKMLIYVLAVVDEHFDSMESLQEEANRLVDEELPGILDAEHQAEVRRPKASDGTWRRLKDRVRRMSRKIRDWKGL